VWHHLVARFDATREANKMWREIGVVVCSLLAAGSASAQQIVIYDSRNEGNRPAVDAGLAIGADVHAYQLGEQSDWIADVLDGADIVVLDVNSNYSERSDQLDALVTYMTAYPEGKAVCATWFMSLYPSHPIWQIMDIQFCSDIATTVPIYQWATHPIWTGIPNPIRNQETDWLVDGAMVTPIGAGVAVGGFTQTPAYCQGGLVVNGQNRTVYIGETGRGGTYDDDGDGVRDWVELYTNVFAFLLTAPTPLTETSWSRVKNLYR
jgi:hypothetical protein